MTKNNESKNERMTKLQGVYVDMFSSELEKVEFEIEIPYARAEKKQIDAVKKHFGLSESAGVVITSVIQPETERKIYDTGLLYLSGAEMFQDEDEAKERAKEIHGKCVAGKLYEYETHVFWFDIEENEYGVTDFDYQTGYNCTAQDARAMLYMRFEEIYRRKPIAMHVFENQRGFIKHEYTTYYVGSTELFADCERDVKHREK